MKRVTVKSGCIMLVKTGLDSQRNGGATASTSVGNNSGCVGEIPGGSGTTWISAWARKWSIFAGTPVSVAMVMSLPSVTSWRKIGLESAYLKPHLDL